MQHRKSEFEVRCSSQFESGFRLGHHNRMAAVARLLGRLVASYQLTTWAEVNKFYSSGACVYLDYTYYINILEDAYGC